MPFPPQHLAYRPVRIVRLCATLLILASSLVMQDPRSARAQRLDSGTRAVAAMQRLERDFFDPRVRSYTVAHLKNGPIASVWPVSQVLAAAVDLFALTHVPADRARIYRIVASLAGS